MAEVRICGVPEVPTFIEQFHIEKLLSCLSHYNIVDSAYGFTQSVLNLNPKYWSDPKNWLKLNMEDTPIADSADAPTMGEVVKGITFGSEAIRSGKNLLVHCQLGLSRSPAMAIGSMIKAGATVEDAYARAIQVRPRIDPNPLIIQYIDENLNLNGELIKYNTEHRAKTRSNLKAEYQKVMESYLHDHRTMNTIFENISALDRL